MKIWFFIVFAFTASLFMSIGVVKGRSDNEKYHAKVDRMELELARFSAVKDACGGYKDANNEACWNHGQANQSKCFN